MAFTREELAAYEKQPAKHVSDKVNPFRGATPAKAADAAAVAAVAAGNVDATPGGAPAAAAAAANTDPLVDDSPVVDEEGTLGDPTESGEGTSDVTTEDSSASAVDPGDETDPNTDLTGEQPADEDAAAAPAPKKGSAAERIVEVLDLADGYKEYGKLKDAENQELRARLAALENKGAPAAAVAPPAAEVDEPMPDMADEDVNFDTDKYRVKMQKWVKTQVKQGTVAAVREITNGDSEKKVYADLDAKCDAFAKTHPDFKKTVTDNRVLAENQLAKDAGLAVARSEHAAEMLYRFGKDTAHAIRVARMSPAEQLLAVGEMLAEIKAEKKAGMTAPGKTTTTPQGGAKPTQRKSITQAPPPPRATPAAGRAEARNVLDPNMSIEEFARQHRAGKQNAREQNRKSRGLN